MRVSPDWAGTRSHVPFDVFSGTSACWKLRLLRAVRSLIAAGSSASRTLLRPSTSISALANGLPPPSP